MPGKSAALVVGAGQVTGAALLRRFAANDFTAVGVRRDGDALKTLVSALRAEGGDVRGLCADATDEDAVAKAVDRIESEIGPIALAVYNVGAFYRGEVLALEPSDYRAAWEQSAWGAYLVGRSVARGMVARRAGTLVFIGSTASLRGSANFAAMAGGRHALRALAQSMARELGPRGIHVTHIVIDGGIDSPEARAALAARGANASSDALILPADIAATCLMLHGQPRTAWTQEITLRPWMERW